VSVMNRPYLLARVLLRASIRRDINLADVALDFCSEVSDKLSGNVNDIDEASNVASETTVPSGIIASKAISITAHLPSSVIDVSPTRNV